jgi:hypothetical protein
MQVADAQFYSSLDASTAGILAASDPTIAIDTDLVPNSNFPAAEGPANLLDGDSSTKYLNFGKVNAGFIVTPDFNYPSIVNSFTITTANDAPERDPGSWALYGSLDDITSDSNSRGLDESWTLIDSGNLSLTTDRLVTSGAIAVEQAVAYTSYRFVVSSLRDGVNANSVQFADVQFDGRVVPEPAAWVLALSTLGALGFARFRRS